MWTAIVASIVLMNSALAPGQNADAPAAGSEKAEATATSEEKSPATTADSEAPAATTNTPLAEKAAEETPAKDVPAAATQAPAENAAPSNTVSREEQKDASDSPLPAGKTDASLATKAVEGTPAAAGADGDAAWHPWAILLILVGLFVIPIMIGNYLGRIWKMPDHAWKISLSLAVLAG